MGKNMKHALAFARQYPGWHTWDKHCQATQKAILRLWYLGLVEVNQYHQFRAVV